MFTLWSVETRIRPDIRLQNPVPAPAPAEQNLPDFCRIFVFFKIIFSANIMNRVAWIVEESGFQKNLQTFWLIIFSVRVILDMYLLYRKLPLPNSCCKGEGCLLRSHYRGETSSSKLGIEGCGIRKIKTEKIFSAIIMNRVAWIVKKSGF